MPAPLESLGRALVFAGLIFLACGGLLLAAGKIPWLGRLPGDIHVRRENFSFYFPVTTSILVSIVLSLLLSFLRRK